MTNRWSVLGLLFLVRTAMAFQFESVAAIGPVLQRDFGVGLPAIGMLIGLYLLPGVVIALPGGMIGRALGDKRVPGPASRCAVEQACAALGQQAASARSLRSPKSCSR